MDRFSRNQIQALREKHMALKELIGELDNCEQSIQIVRGIPDYLATASPKSLSEQEMLNSLDIGEVTDEILEETFYLGVNEEQSISIMKGTKAAGLILDALEAEAARLTDLIREVLGEGI